MTTSEIDLLLGGSPCLCGAVDTWHHECYAGKSGQQIVKERSTVYARIRRALTVKRREIVKATIEAVKRQCGDNGEQR